MVSLCNYCAFVITRNALCVAVTLNSLLLLHLVNNAFTPGERSDKDFGRPLSQQDGDPHDSLKIRTPLNAARNHCVLRMETSISFDDNPSSSRLLSQLPSHHDAKHKESPSSHASCFSKPLRAELGSCRQCLHHILCQILTVRRAGP